MKQKAFTLIELLVVIVIIGILATITTATFGDAGGKALISKYRAERVQATKERYDECLTVYSNDTSQCFLRTIVYNRNDGRLYKKNADEYSVGIPITPAGVRSSPVFSPDGKFIYYTYSAEPTSRIYKKSINDTTNGTAITVSRGGTPAVSPDGEYIIYSYGPLYKKNADDVFDGTAITTDSAGGAAFSPDGKYIVYPNYSNFGVLYKKSANDTSNGEAINNLTYSSNPIFSPDGDTLYYYASGQMYKKNFNDAEDGVAITPSGSTNSLPMGISQDGGTIYYMLTGDNFQMYQKNTSDNLAGTLHGPRFVGNSIGVFPW